MANQLTRKSKASPKRGASTKTAPQTSLPAFIKPFMLGSVFGAILCLCIQWFLFDDFNDGESKESIANTEEPIKSAQTPELNFYETLPNAEVPVSAEAIAYEAEKLNYFLQAGSFRQKEDADALRVQLILLNLEAEIQTITQDDGSTWHRVLAGPFAERTEIAKTRSTLLENDIQSIIISKPLDD